MAVNTEIRAGDALVLEARPDALDEFRSALSLAFSDTDREARLTAEGKGVDVIELVVPHDARIVGKTAQSVGLHWRQRSVLLGISRQGRKITQPVRKTSVRAGDILLLLVPRDRGATSPSGWAVCPLPIADSP